MRRCTLLPITDSVGGAIGFKVFEEVEKELRRSSWCTYVSNSSLLSVFSRYRENLPQYLKNKEVLARVAEKLTVGSLALVSLKNELGGVEVSLTVYGENGEDIYYAEKSLVESEEIEELAGTISGWLDLYAKTIPYDAMVSGVLGDQVTLDVGKNFNIQSGRDFDVIRAIGKRKHPLLKKIVDWETRPIGEGAVFNSSDTQALGMMKDYSAERKVLTGDWVRFQKVKPKVVNDKALNDEEEDKPGTLGMVSVALFASSSSLDNTTPTGANRMSGNVFGVDMRGEGWITRQYFAALEIERGFGGLDKSSGSPQKNSVNFNYGAFKLTGGYKYLPIGFFYGPQIDLYGGYANYSFDVDVSRVDGFGKVNFSGLLLGSSANVPIGREYRFMARAELMPFPSFSEEDGIYGGATSVSSMELEIGLKYYYTPKMSLDGSIETFSRKAKFSGSYKEISYKDNRLKLGVSFNF